jgi:hypothetical protein
MQAIISVCGGSINGLDPCDDIQTAHVAFNKAQSAFTASYTSITKKHWKELNNRPADKPYKGCDQHYNAAGHAVLAGDIAPQVAAVLGWA